MGMFSSDNGSRSSSRCASADFATGVQSAFSSSMQSADGLESAGGNWWDLQIGGKVEGGTLENPSSSSPNTYMMRHRRQPSQQGQVGQVGQVGQLNQSGQILLEGRDLGNDVMTTATHATNSIDAMEEMEQAYREWVETMIKQDMYKPVVILADQGVREGRILANVLKTNCEESWSWGIREQDCLQAVRIVYNVYEER